MAPHEGFLIYLGPAEYDPKVKAIQSKGGKMIYKETRFKEVQDDMPGPGTYEVKYDMIMV